MLDCKYKRRSRSKKNGKRYTLVSVFLKTPQYDLCILKAILFLLFYIAESVVNQLNVGQTELSGIN